MIVQAYKIHSAQPIDRSLGKVLDEVDYRLSPAFHFKEHQYRIFLCHNTPLFRQFADKVGKPARVQGFNLQPLDHIFINLPCRRSAG